MDREAEGTLGVPRYGDFGAPEEDLHGDTSDICYLRQQAEKIFSTHTYK